MLSPDLRAETQVRLIKVCIEILDTSAKIAWLDGFGAESVDLHIHLAVMKQLKAFYDQALACDYTGQEEEQPDAGD